ncbi:hypothetical protein GSI_02078 [Ganoderma sinense ZZ0214-1]|uniref:Uncharacterized protein n=1 Tax=Ganoderma sinense ZZ0214-1 TaxID=1077348 RepID=A0A2G8SNL9_9APHY|nr:hypothetical protein GSI_02078 [Ganoderma sinense ZZ0214-1]
MTAEADEHGKTYVVQSGVGCRMTLTFRRTRHVLRAYGAAREEREASEQWKRRGRGGCVPAAALACRGRARKVRHGTRRCAARAWVALIRDRRSVERRCGGGGRSVGRRAVRWKLGRR